MRRSLHKSISKVSQPIFVGTFILDDHSELHLSGILQDMSQADTVTDGPHLI
jgi:hypothetical protein